MCIPIKKKTIAAVLKDLQAAAKEANLVEIWFDELEPKHFAKIFHQSKLPIIYKATSKNIDEVLRFKPDYIDLDISTSIATVKKVKEISPRTKIILSFHDFKKTPPESELKKIISKLLNKGADIVKIATQAKNISDSFTMLELLKQTTDKGQRAIFLCMGKEGLITRTSGHLFGNYLMYAPLKSSDKTAPGQLTVKELKKIIANTCL